MVSAFVVVFLCIGKGRSIPPGSCISFVVADMVLIVTECKNFVASIGDSKRWF